VTINNILLIHLVNSHGIVSSSSSSASWRIWTPRNDKKRK